MTVHFDSVRILTQIELDAHLSELCRVLIDSVRDGAAVSFMANMTKSDAEQFWRQEVGPRLVIGHCHLFGAFVDDVLVGTVQLVTGMPPNQPHRAEISKMIVHPEVRRRGLGKALMTAALDLARDKGKKLVTLDTRTGDVSEGLYRSVGFMEAGKIPDYAFDPDGQARHSTTYMYCYI